MALYNIEIIEKPGHPKALALIGSLANIHPSEAKRRLRRIPMTVQASVPLTDAVSIQRQLSRVGVQSRIYRSDISIEDSTQGRIPPSEPAVESEEIIEIPDAEVRVLDHTGAPAPRIEVRRVRPAGAPAWRRYGILTGAGLALLALGYVISSYQKGKHIEEDAVTAMEDWRRTLQDQEVLLDRGMSAEAIAGKLAEIERKLETLWRLLKSKEQVESLQKDFARARERAHDEILDLDFRRGLEKASVSINPTCSIDQGRVRGYSDLPDGARLRVRLFGAPGVEAVSYAAQVRDRVFELVIDPAIESSVYDARATIAPYAQQPQAVQEWAQTVFNLQPGGRKSGELGEAPPAGGSLPPPPKQEGAPITAGVPSAGLPPGHLENLSGAPDSQIVQALSSELAQWEKLAQSASSHLEMDQGPTLEDIYQYLLNLEARIDQLIEWLQSPALRDSCNLSRDGFYGQYRDFRQELQKRHQDYSRLRSPSNLESRLQRAFRDGGAAQLQVIVLDSPSRAGFFTIEIESGEPASRRDAVWPIMAQIISVETSRASPEIDAVRFRDAAGTTRWILAKILEAADGLDQAGGTEQCLKILRSPHLLGAP